MESGGAHLQTPAPAVEVPQEIRAPIAARQETLLDEDDLMHDVFQVRGACFLIDNQAAGGCIVLWSHTWMHLQIHPWTMIQVRARFV